MSIIQFTKTLAKSSVGTSVLVVAGTAAMIFTYKRFYKPFADRRRFDRNEAIANMVFEQEQREKLEKSL